MCESCVRAVVIEFFGSGLSGGDVGMCFNEAQRNDKRKWPLKRAQKRINRHVYEN